MSANPYVELTRPIVGIENRTTQEVFDIMCDRIKSSPRGGVVVEPGILTSLIVAASKMSAASPGHTANIHKAIDILADLARTKSQAADALEAATASRQIEWTPGEPPKEAGVVVYGHTWQPYRWQPYKPTSEQFRRGVKGRWQAMNEYGGWDNAKVPDEWASEGAVLARTALAEQEKG